MSEPRPLGARPLAGDGTEFRVWAPRHEAVVCEVDGAGYPMLAESDGFWHAHLPVGPGARYGYLLDGTGPFPDPCSRRQPEGVQGLSEVVSIESPKSTWQAPEIGDLVIYEIHIGTFTQAGTYRAVIERLSALRALGIRAIELMPLGTFPGTRGWGYDGLYTWAPQESYGSAADLRALIEAAHDADLGVIIDVVYNHIGPGSEKITAFGPYFASQDPTLWGAALDYRALGVREWAIGNAEMWLSEYGADGLRLDAVHAIRDPSSPHVMAELATRVRAINPRALVISETSIGDLRPIRDWGHDAQWNDALHHALHVLVTGEHDGYYADYGTLADVVTALEAPGHERFVVCAQNHDQVGNRAFGDRLTGAKLRLVSAGVLFSDSVPLLFMGEERGEAHPFQFFTDHIDPAIATATREGRREEFSRFTSFSAEEIPDPQDKATFLSSKLSRATDPATYEQYRALLELRRGMKGAAIRAVADEKRRYLRIYRANMELSLNFSDRECDGVAPFSVALRP
jgi:maltooligosyltrehalose trehalohydrolase